MSIVVVGGQARKVGKTSVVTGLISAIRERRWTAIKTSGHIHHSAPVAAEKVIAAGRAFVLMDDTSLAGDKDTSRFVVAGAERAYWLQVEKDGLAEAMPHLREIITTAADVIVESNSIVQWLTPDLYLLVLDFGVAEFKRSTRQSLANASAFLLNCNREEPLWTDMALPRLPDRPKFSLRPPQYVTGEMIEFVRRTLASRRS